MTYTKQEQILAAAATMLAATAGAPGRVYRSRQDAFARSESPAVVIEPGPDKATMAVSNCKINWSFALVVAVYARGAIPDQVADPLVHSIHCLLMADRSLGGLAMDVVPMGRDPQFEKADQPAVWVVLTYLVTYRTSVEDLSV